jgi:hypothetical protein
MFHEELCPTGYAVNVPLDWKSVTTKHDFGSYVVSESSSRGPNKDNIAYSCFWCGIPAYDIHRTLLRDTA